MKTRISVALSVGVMLLSGATAGNAWGAGANCRVDSQVDRAQGIYRTNEQATITATVFRDGKPATNGEVTIRVRTWTGKMAREETLPYEGKPVQMKMTYDKPGFLICHSAYKAPDGAEGKERDGVGLGFDPEKLEPATVMPDDFDAFWEAARKERDTIPMDLKLTEYTNVCTPKVTVFKISVANINGTRAYGYLNVPKQGNGPFGVSVVVPGAGAAKGPGGMGSASGGAIVLEPSVHAYDIPPYDGEPVDGWKVYNSLGNYKLIGAPDKKKSYFYRAILGIDRLIGYVASRPDVDRKRFGIGGESQGGGLTLILGGLNNDKFTSIWSKVPGICDQAAYRLDRETSWPGLIPGEVRKDPVKEPIYREFAAYFDAVNFARRIKAPTIIGAGMADDCCFAANIYSAYNVITAPKRIAAGPKTIHPGTPPAMPGLSDKEWGEIVKQAGEEIGKGASRQSAISDR